MNKQVIADNADIIVNNYAFKKNNNIINIINLMNLKKIVISTDKEIIKTNMDDIEISIVLKYYQRNKKYLED